MNDDWKNEARYLVEANREKYPELLIAQMATAMQDRANATVRARLATDLCRVAIGMLADAGKLKPKTDDERAAVKLAGMLVFRGNRRVLDPCEPYVETLVSVARRLFEEPEAA